MTGSASGMESADKVTGGPCTDEPCTDAKEHIWDYLDGEMNEGDCARIKAHIETCPPCEDLFKAESTVKSAIARACGCEEVPQDLRSRIAAKVSAMKSELCGGKDN